MPVITALQKQKRRPRVDVHLDGVYAFSLDLALAVESGLASGQDFSYEQRRKIEAEDQRRGAVATALRLLSIGPRSEQELRDRLRRRGFPRDTQDAAILRMQELGYLDDAAFARLYVEMRQSATPRSRRALTFELKRKGIEQELAVESVTEVSDVDAAYDAAQRRLRALSKLDRQTFTRRFGSFLASRGFAYGVARNAIDRCWAELQATRDADVPDADDSEL